MKRRLRDLAFAFLLAGTGLLGTGAPAAGAEGFGGPLPGLPAPLRVAFRFGQARFGRVETPATGLGPVFNGRSCLECHSHPAPGGTGVGPETRVVRFGSHSPGRPFDPLTGLGGPTLQRHSVAGEVPGCHLAGEVVPPEANVVGLRQPPPLFGIGLMEAIPASTILAHADPDDVNGDGIAGRPNLVGGRLGRFGWKAAEPGLLGFVGLALRNELGVTNFLFRDELPPQGQPIPPGCKLTRDPEDQGARLVGLYAFLAYLAPPPRGPLSPVVLRGERRFAEVGCAGCHIPTLRTGLHPVAALRQRDVPLYSDLLTHYMGEPLNDGIPEGRAGGGRWRTAPLWGLRVRTRFLHDARAASLLEAIQLHAGEAREVRRRFFGLSAADRTDLLAFLQSL